MEFTDFVKRTALKSQYTDLLTIPALRHKHDFFEFLLPISGKAENRCNGKSQVIQPGDILLVRPNDEHEVRILPTSELHSHRDVYVSIEKMRRICDSLSPDLYGNILSHSDPIYFHIGLSMLRSLENKLSLFGQNQESVPDYESFHTCIIYEIFSYYIEMESGLRAEKTTLNPPNWLREFISNLNQLEYMSQNIETLAKMTNYSRMHLYREFKKYMGKSLDQYLIESRINYSFALLAETEYSIAQISTILGYDSQNSYTRNFVKLTGTTPSSWRKQIRAGDEPPTLLLLKKQL